jgi:two-component system copper resistance phosphate regulon response regulator CusR
VNAVRILVVEDERNLNQVLCKKLKLENYAVDCCFDGLEALDYLTTADYDVIVLDIMMPQKDGYSVLSEMRAKGYKTPVLLLTAKDSIDDRIKGLDLGADDYLTKPFSFGELMARLRALTRRPVGQTTNRYEFEDLVVDTDTRTATRGGENISLSHKEFAVLENLIRNKEVVLTRDQIEQNAWDISFEGGSNVVDVYIRFLRKKIDDEFPVKLIHTVRGTGYVMRVEE